MNCPSYKPRLSNHKKLTLIKYEWGKIVLTVRKSMISNKEIEQTCYQIKDRQ